MIALNWTIDESSYEPGFTKKKQKGESQPDIVPVPFEESQKHKDLLMVSRILRSGCYFCFVFFTNVYSVLCSFFQSRCINIIFVPELYNETQDL